MSCMLLALRIFIVEGTPASSLRDSRYFDGAALVISDRTELRGNRAVPRQDMNNFIKTTERDRMLSHETPQSKLANMF